MWQGQDSSQKQHELVQVFLKNNMPLSSKLVDMLNEHHSHQTERRGCGYTQASRVLAEYVNYPRSDTTFSDGKLFAEFPHAQLQYLLDNAAKYNLILTSWRNLDLNSNVQSYLSSHPENNPFTQSLMEQFGWQHTLRHLHTQLHLEESLLWMEILKNIILPSTSTNIPILPVLADRPKVGSCPMAEKFFLEIAHGRTPRRGRINVIVDHKQKPILLEKINMGDDHSCICLKPVLMNGVVLPAGSSFAVLYDEHIHKTPTTAFNGDILSLDDCRGFWFLRMTTLGVSPENRQRAFSTHFNQQVLNDLFSPKETTLEQLIEIANRQLR